MSLPPPHRPYKVRRGSLSLKELEKGREINQDKYGNNPEEIDVKKNVDTSFNPFIFMDQFVGGKFTDVFLEIKDTETLPGSLKKIIKPRWFVNTPFGKPRNVDTIRLRELSLSYHVQRAVGRIINGVKSANFDYVAKDRETADSPQFQKIREDFIKWTKKVNSNNESFKDILGICTRDILEIAAGAPLKHFLPEAHKILSREIDFDPSATDIFELIKIPTVQTIVPSTGPIEFNGERALRELTAEDGATFLKQFDYHGTLLGFWQHSFLSTVTSQSTSPVVPRFYSKREMPYIALNKPSFDDYGWGPVQQLQDVLVVLIATVLNTAKYKEKGDMLPGYLELRGVGDEEFKAFRKYFQNQLQGNPSKFGIISTPEKGQVNFVPLTYSLQDVFFLDGMRFYEDVVISTFFLTPNEVGITDNVNRASAEEQGKVADRTSRVPILGMWEEWANMNISPEFDPEGLGEFKWIPTENLDKEIKKQEVNASKLNLGQLTINETRIEDGLEPIEGGDVLFAHLVIPQISLSQSQGIEGTDRFPGDDNESQTIQDLIAEISETMESGDDIDGEEDEDEEAIEVEETDKSLVIKVTESKIKKKKLKSTTKQFDDTDLSNRELSEKVDEFIDGFAPTIQAKIREIIKEWQEQVLGLIRSRIREGVDINTAMRELIGILSQPSITIFEQIANVINGTVMDAFREGQSKDNEMEETEELGIFNVLPADAIEFLQNNSLILADDLVSDTEKRIRRQLIEGLSRGESIDQIAERVTEVFDALPTRAEVIARTEVIRSLANGKLATFERMGVKQWQYFAHIDDRTSCECRELHLKIFPIDDTEFLPPRHPNCRCTILAVLD